MQKLKMYCISMDNKHLNFIKEANYIPVGLGNDTFSSEWVRDNTGENISQKNNYYGEYTFHYWFWKNHLHKIDDGWFGFCQYRKFWSLNTENLLPNSLDQLKSEIINEIPNSYENFDVILGDLYFINQLRLMKFIKKGFKLIIKNPSCLFSEKKRNIKFHFDLMHGEGRLDKAIKLLDKENKNDFNDFVNTKISFNPHNMFICKSKKILNDYYATVFPWLKRCEKEFGFKKLDKWSEIRIYAFLAERFMSYWFQKNSRYKTMPIVFYDIKKDFI